MVYILPITKATENIDSHSYLTFSGGVDVNYYSDRYNNGSVLIDKARYIRAERLNSVVGKTKPEFLSRLIDKLSGTFNFKHNLPTVSSEISSNIQNVPVRTEDTSNVASSNEEVEVTLPNVDGEDSTNSECETTIKTQKDVEPIKNNMTSEEILNIAVGDALKILEPGGSILKNTYAFLEAIGMPTDNSVLNEAFIAAADIKKINYGFIVGAIYNRNKEMSCESIEENLKKTFKDWLATKEELASYNRLALTSLLKLFAKAVRA